jgi:hypothetical protein
MADSPNGVPMRELNLFLIVYELASPPNGEPATDQLLRTLEGHPATTRLTDSAWVVRTPRSVSAVFDALDEALAPDDRLFVGSLTGEAAWRNIEHGYDWLEEAFAPGARVA